MKTFGQAIFVVCVALMFQTAFSSPRLSYQLDSLDLGVPSWGIAEADFNRDGKIDLASRGTDGAVYLFTNMGGHTFSKSVIATGILTDGGAMASGDFNSDGWPDIALTNYSDTVYLLLGINGSDFTGARVATPTGQLSGVDCGDINGDGKTDIACIHYHPGRVDIYAGDGMGGFSFLDSFTVVPDVDMSGGIPSVVIGDFDGDGKADIIAGQDDDVRPGDAWLYSGDGSGRFSLSGKWYDTNPADSTGTDVWGSGHAKAYDFDSDGKLDVITPSSASSRSAIDVFWGASPAPYGNPDTLGLAGPWCDNTSTPPSGFEGREILAAVASAHTALAHLIWIERSWVHISAGGPFSPCENVPIIIPITVDATQPLSGVNIPLKIPAGVTVSSVSLAVPGWHDYSVVYNDSGYVQLVAVAGAAAALPIGTTTVFNLNLTATRLCKANWVFRFDTTFSTDLSRSLQATDTTFAKNSVSLGFSRSRDSVVIEGYSPGDLDNNGSKNLADLSKLVSFLTGGGYVICVKSAADVNRNGVVNLGDLSFFVAYFTTGSPSSLECAYSSPTPRVNTLGGNLAVKTSYEDGMTTVMVSTPLDLNAVQLTVQGVALTPENSLSGSLDLLQGEKDGQTNIILIDMKGRNTIGLGTTQLVRIPGQVEVVKAEASDLAFESYDLAINPASKPSDLPKEFSLAQNYPNPFNPTTKISFSLPVTSDYTLSIFNVTGQQVAEFFGTAGPGTVERAWDATQNASGVYFYKLTAGSYTATKKMMLLK